MTTLQELPTEIIYNITMTSGLTPASIVQFTSTCRQMQYLLDTSTLKVVRLSKGCDHMLTKTFFKELYVTTSKIGKAFREKCLHSRDEGYVRALYLAFGDKINIKAYDCLAMRNAFASNNVRVATWLIKMSDNAWMCDEAFTWDNVIARDYVNLVKLRYLSNPEFVKDHAHIFLALRNNSMYTVQYLWQFVENKAAFCKNHIMYISSFVEHVCLSKKSDLILWFNNEGIAKTRAVMVFIATHGDKDLFIKMQSALQKKKPFPQSEVIAYFYAACRSGKLRFAKYVQSLIEDHTQVNTVIAFRSAGRGGGIGLAKMTYRDTHCVNDIMFVFTENIGRSKACLKAAQWLWSLLPKDANIKEALGKALIAAAKLRTPDNVTWLLNVCGQERFRPFDIVIALAEGTYSPNSIIADAIYAMCETVILDSMSKRWQMHYMWDTAHRYVMSKRDI